MPLSSSSLTMPMKKTLGFPHGNHTPKSSETNDIRKEKMVTLRYTRVLRNKEVESLEPKGRLCNREIELKIVRGHKDSKTKKKNAKIQTL